MPIFQIGSSHSTFILHRHHYVVCVHTLTLFTAACFFLCTPSLTTFCLKFISFPSCSSHSFPSIPHFYFLQFFHQVCHSFLFPPVCVWMCVCVCVCLRLCEIITRPPRGNQQWSLDSPDPLVPQHTCPWGAFPMSSEPLCVHVATPSVPQLGGVAVGMLHYLLEICTRAHTQQRKPGG